jgi:hypothetical protein
LSPQRRVTDGYPSFVTEAAGEKRGKIPASFIKMITGTIITINEPAMPKHTPETKISLSSGWKKANQAP